MRSPLFYRSKISNIIRTLSLFQEDFPTPLGGDISRHFVMHWKIVSDELHGKSSCIQLTVLV